MWAIILMSAVALFAYLLSVKIEVLVNKEKKVDFDVDYPNRLPFPAITVCNQNEYR